MVYMLTYQPSVEMTVIAFVALKIIPDIPAQFINSLIDDQMKDRIF